MTAIEVLAELLKVRELRAEVQRLKQRGNYRVKRHPDIVKHVDGLKADADKRWPLAWEAALRLVAQHNATAVLNERRDSEDRCVRPPVGPQVSYWQRGCDDAKAGLPATLNGRMLDYEGPIWNSDQSVQGYLMGYRVGKGLVK